VNSPVLDAYLAGIDPKTRPLVVALDSAIRMAQPDFDVAIKYQILMYALHGDWRTWVCAIDARSKGACLRFLYGVLLDDPRGVLRAGSSVLKTWDFGVNDVVDPAAVGVYVAEAVGKYTEYKTNAPAVLEASRAAATAGRKRKSSG
jgi:hypothetical protein